MAKIRLISLNVRGLNHPAKRRIAMADLRKQKCDFAFLQETHFRSDSAPTLRSTYFTQGFYSNFEASKSRGVAILVASHIPFTCTSQMADPQGRFIFIKGHIGSRLVTLANLYLPNTHQCTALRKILNKLAKFAEGLLFCGGDFNISPDSPKEAAAPPGASQPSKRRRFHQLLQTFQLVDCWRAMHPAGRDYTFYSHAARVYSRLDLFLMSHHTLHLIRTVSIGSITWSDHAPVLMDLEVPDLPPRQYQWRLNESLLKDVVHREYLTEAITHYFDENDNGEVTDPLLWEAHKSVLRGQLIQLGARCKRDRGDKIQSLLADIQTFETLHKTTPSAEHYSALSSLRSELRELLHHHACRSLLLTKRSYYLHGNKCGKLLARALRQKYQSTYIPKLRRSDGSVTHLNDEIIAEFHTYYHSLYNLRDSPPPAKLMADYLAKALDVAISPDQAEALDVPFTSEELAEALKATPTGKSPGPDGFSIGYYRTFLKTLGPYLLRSFNAIDEGTSFPAEALRATISLIPKPGKDPLSCSNYRPISLINNDIKLMAKMLARRLNPILPSLIHPDQVGFVPLRGARDNTLRAINLLHISRVSSTPMLFLSVDAEKAFDRVDWSFLITVLAKLGLGPRWLAWVSALYSNPTALLRVNGSLSSPLSVRNGTRQGCPLSPILFIITLEPFLQRLRDNECIRGYNGPLHEYKVSAFADDVLLTIIDPLQSLPAFLREVHLYAAVSNFKINTTKCEAIGVDIPDATRLQIRSLFPFSWQSEAITYLGLRLPSDLTLLYTLNYEPLLHRVRSDLQAWDKPHFSWFGRINIIKMSILPKFLYLFQTLPIHVTPSFFNTLRSLFGKFIWADKRPRLAFRLLTRPKHGED
uniref:Reverse transcriptase domain-containing protein n=1 Tax=Leptobrachium leishanense TaxID=445787 RepID=A0A8C5WHL5_9ANUR